MNDFKRHFIHRTSTLKEALIQLDILARDAILFIIDDGNKLIGSLTDGDVRRGLISGYNINSCVEEICKKEPKIIRRNDFDIKKLVEFRNNNIKIIPILDDNDVVINIINFRELKSFLPIDVVIMAGGRGERLRPLTDSVPKPLLKIGKKPIIEHSIDRLKKFGVENIWITLRYLGNKIEEYFGDGESKDLRIKYQYENTPLGTIGSLSNIKDIKNKFLLVINSDILTNIDYEQFFLDFLNHNADLSVVTIPYSVDIPYAVFETIDRKIISLKEKPTYTYYSNGGIYLMKKELVNFIPIDEKYDATDLIEKLIIQKRKIITYPLTSYWLDIGRHEDYIKAQNDISYVEF